MSAHRADGDGARIRYLSARAHATGAARRSLAAQSSGSAAGAAGQDQARAARHVLYRRRRLENDGLRTGPRGVSASRDEPRRSAGAQLKAEDQRQRRTPMRTFKALLSAAIVAVALGAPAALAITFKFADQGDALSMDPHALNESLQLSIMGSVYEPLVGRGKKLELVPILATSWKQTSPTVWRFVLRKDVKFHDGTPFTADDVI